MPPLWITRTLGAHMSNPLAGAKHAVSPGRLSVPPAAPRQAPRWRPQLQALTSAPTSLRSGIGEEKQNEETPENRSGTRPAGRPSSSNALGGPRLPRKLRVGARPAHGVVRPLDAQAGNPGSENGQRLISATSA